MNQNAVMVIADEQGTFHWVLLAIDGGEVATQTASDAVFNDYESALRAGCKALAALEVQFFESDPDPAAALAPLLEPVPKPADGRESDRGWPWAPEQSVPPA